jgi:hypothetical protein
MKLFDFIKVFFSLDGQYEELKHYDKGKNRFMLNRFMAIKFPINAQALNRNGTDAGYIVDSWRMVVLNNNFKRTPGWIYTKVRNKEVKDEKVFKPKDETIKFYLDKYKLSMRDYKDCIKFNSKELLNELQKIEKAIEEA